MAMGSRCLTILLLSLAVILPGGFVNASTLANPIEQKKTEIQKLEKKITEQKQEISQREARDFSYDNYLAKLQIQLAANANEQFVLKEMIELTKIEITDKEAAVKHQETVLRYQKEILGSYLRELNRFDRVNKILKVFISYQKITVSCLSERVKKRTCNHHFPEIGHRLIKRWNFTDYNKLIIIQLPDI